MDVTFAGTDLSDAVPAAIVTRTTRRLLGERRDTYDYLPGREGSTIFAEKPGDRILSVDITIVGSSLALRRSAVRALAGWADSDVRENLIFSDESDRYWEAKLDNAPDPSEWLLKGDATLDFRAGPYAKAVTLSSSTFSASAAGASAFNIEDEVDAWPVIEVTAVGAMAEGFTLTVNGTALVYATALANAATVTVSSISYTVSTGANTDTDLTGAFVVADLSMAGVSGDFAVLVPGENTIEIDHAATVVIHWRRRYR